MYVGEPEIPLLTNHSIGEVIGEGCFGKVKKAYNKLLGVDVALKFI